MILKPLLFAGACALFSVAAIAQQTSSISSNFNGTPIRSNDYIWFSANFTAHGIPSTGATIYLTSSTIMFPNDPIAPVSVPNAQITFKPGAVCSLTTYDSSTDTWETIVPVNGSDEIFLAGVVMPASVLPASGLVKGPVVWQGAFGSSLTTGPTINWKWSAAVYTAFSTDYNAVAPKPTHGATCGYSNSDHAGTPEGTDTGSNAPYKVFVTGGARGGGGSEWTGSWSGTAGVVAPFEPPPGPGPMFM